MHHDYQANIQQCYEPSKKKVQQLNHLSAASDMTELKRKDDLLWFLLKTLSPLFKFSNFKLVDMGSL